MKLQTKFNLAFLAAFIIGTALAGCLTYRVVQANAEAEVLAKARVIVDNAQAFRNYNTREVSPLLMPLMAERFLPQSVSAYAAQTTLRAVRERLPEYAYKEAALNPTNLIDRPAKWEAEIIHTFRGNPALGEIVTIRDDTPTGPALVLVHPLKVTEPGCLHCHGRPEEAPRSMLAIYGAAHGFGWQMNETIGAQIVSVPMAVPLQRAMTTFLVFMGTLVAGYVVIAVLLNVLLRVLAVRPVRQIAATATAVSLGQLDAPEVEWNSRDEIGALAAAFNRMRSSLESALRLLGG